MDISAYRNRGRRPIELPSGLRGFVRAPSVMDLAAYPRLLPAGQNGAAEDAAGRAAAMGDWVHCVLRRCFLPERGAMTDKEPGACGPAELSVHELTAEDAGAILAAVGELGALAAGGGEAAPAPFPTGPAGAPRPDPPPGEDLRPAPAPSGGG